MTQACIQRAALVAGDNCSCLFVQNGEEMERIARREKGNASILSLACCPKRDEDTDVIAVVDKNQTLSLYDATGRQVGMNSRRQTPSDEYFIFLIPLPCPADEQRQDPRIRRPVPAVHEERGVPADRGIQQAISPVHKGRNPDRLDRRVVRVGPLLSGKSTGDSRGTSS